VLWHCWFGGRKGIWPVKTWVVGCWRGCLSGAQYSCIWPSWCHCHSLSVASVKSKLVLPFWYRLTRVVPEKGPLNGCVCVCACVCVSDTMDIKCENGTTKCITWKLKQKITKKWTNAVICCKTYLDIMPTSDNNMARKVLKITTYYIHYINKHELMQS